MDQNILSQPIDIEASEIHLDPYEGISSDGKQWSKFQIESYRRLMVQYQTSSTSFFRQYILRQISLTPKIKQILFQSYEILNFLAKNLMMGELELILWSILIEKIPKEKFITNPILMIAMSGLKSKMVLNDDYEPFLWLLNSMIPNFNVCFRFYLDVFSDEIEVTIRDLNNCYNEMVYRSWKKSHVDYEGLIDNILLKAKGKPKILPKGNSDLTIFPEMVLEKESECFNFLDDEEFPSI